MLYRLFRTKNQYLLYKYMKDNNFNPLIRRYEQINFIKFQINCLKYINISVIIDD